jgi:hypothetical protein
VSYCDTSKPEGEHFVGAVIVRAADVQGAFHEASKIKGVPTEGCLHRCCCHHHIDVAFQEIYRDQEFRAVHRVGRWLPRDEVMTEPTETMDEVEKRTGGPDA